jgi:hypothetical protein
MATIHEKFKLLMEELEYIIFPKISLDNNVTLIGTDYLFAYAGNQRYQFVNFELCNFCGNFSKTEHPSFRNARCLCICEKSKENYSIYSI